jgi:hypothetical protein
MEHSTPITAQLCAQVIDDTIKVVVDVPECLKAVNAAAATATGVGAHADAGVDAGAHAEAGGAAALGAEARGPGRSSAHAHVVVNARKRHGSNDGLDRGGWELVCKDASFVPNPAYCGLELTVFGQGQSQGQGQGQGLGHRQGLGPGQGPELGQAQRRKSQKNAKGGGSSTRSSTSGIGMQEVTL